MTDPAAIDYGSALQKAVFDRLVATVTGASVHQHVPEKTPPPVVIIGAPQSENRAGKGEISDRWTMVIFAVTKGPSQAANLSLQTKVRAGLAHWKATATADVIFGRIGWPDTDTSPVLKDDIYYGTITVTCTTEPAAAG